MHAPESIMGHQRHLVKTAQNELQFARIGVDISNRINAVLISGKFFSIHLNQILVQVQPPIGNGAQLHGQAEKRQKARAGQNERVALFRFQACARQSAAFAV